MIQLFYINFTDKIFFHYESSGFRLFCLTIHYIIMYGRYFQFFWIYSLIFLINFIRRQPFHTPQRLLCQPLRCLVLLQHQISRLHCTNEAIHRQMKLRIIILHGVQKFFHLDLRIQFFPDLSLDCFSGCFPFFNLTSRKFPTRRNTIFCILCA